jgi:precorrin-3B C17-methyltransferase
MNKDKRTCLFIVGLGPGARSLMTAQACAAIAQSEVIVGYRGYFTGLEDLTAGKECLSLPLSQERERARLVVERAARGQRVCVISSGDAGIYGMASLVLEALEASPHSIEVEVVPGVSAIQAAAALLGAPLGHDFAVVSLSDLLTPWPIIARRLRAATEGDFVLALLNPRSQRRTWQLEEARTILLAERRPETPVGIVRQAYRPEQAVSLATLATLDVGQVDMFTTLIVGSSTTRQFGAALITPRGYCTEPAQEDRR